MPAGDSALTRSRELEADADALFALSQRLRRKAHNFLTASASEKELARRLQLLDQLDWQVLEDRRWPGSKRANIDFILVGPGGVVVLDAKSWAEMEVRDGTIFRGQSREDEEIAKLISLVDRLGDELADTGLTSTAITAAMVFSGRRVDTLAGPIAVLGEDDLALWLLRLPSRLNQAEIDRMLIALESCCSPMPTNPSARPALPPAPREIELVPEAETPTLFDVEQLTQSLLDAALARPIEDWMTFLHPSQARLVTQQWNGPARVRGPAGTGKTVVGLHRAVHLAQRHPDPVLFVSFVKTLPVVLASLARRLSPTTADQIDFVGVHRLAHRCLERVDETFRLDTRGAEQAFGRAWMNCGATSALVGLDERRTYWKEEVDHVIKGRGLTEFGQYLKLQRVGRKTPMRAEHRTAMWDLYLAYESRLAEAKIGDFNDLLLRATAAVRRFPELFRFSAVIVDEVQDLNLAAVHFLIALAGDQPERLLFLGDGQQSVYPGGFTLAEAGITVTGRAAVLSQNYRNTVEILDEARRMVSADTFDNFEGIADLGAATAEASRHGHAPTKVHAEAQRDLDAALTSRLMDTRRWNGTPWGHMAVLAERTRTVNHYRQVLADASIPFVELSEYDGQSTDRVKLGTVKRAKGLEFAYVFLPNLSQGPPPMTAGETTDSYAERVDRWRRELYVGMTRARDGLWLGYVGGGHLARQVRTGANAT